MFRMAASGIFKVLHHKKTCKPPLISAIPQKRKEKASYEINVKAVDVYFII